MNTSELFAEWEELFGKNQPWEALKNLETFLNKKNLGEICVEIPSGVFMKGDISIGKGTIVEPGAWIEGPCWIGENCHIRHGAYIRGKVYVGDRSVVGHATEIKNSILLAGSRAAHFNYVGDSIVGSDANLGAGVILANVRHDHQEISVQGSATGMKKFGALVGDGASIGCNSVTNPGTVVLKGATSRPCSSLWGVVS